MNSTRTKALLIEDNPGDARLIREMLADSNGAGGFDIVCSDRLSEAIENLAIPDTDIVLLDLSLPDSQGLEALVKLHTVAQTPPVVVLTSYDDEMTAIKAVQEGAQDYLVKGQFDDSLLIRSIRYAIERHRLKIELEETRQQQLEMKDRFMSRVSHELRTPLAAIYQFVTILLDGLAGELTPEQRDYLDITLRNTNQLKTMVSDLLEVTRAQTNRLKVNPQYVSLPELVKEILQTIEIASGKAISLVNDVPDDSQPLYADPDRVRQIIVNLINNAIQFTPHHGTITVRAEVYQEDPDYLCISVSDTGCGINPEEQGLIFDYLYQADNNVSISRRGLGLGLNICKELVSSHGGEIWVESEVDKGSTFYFTLPVFSLKRLLAPILEKTDPKTISLTHITVEASPTEKRQITKSDDIALKEVSNIINRCIPKKLGQLLPAAPDNQCRQVFFAVTFASPLDTEILFSQIEQQLVNCESLIDAGLDSEVSFTMLDIPANESTPSDQLLEDIISRIDDQMQTELANRCDTHGHQKNSYC